MISWEMSSSSLLSPFVSMPHLFYKQIGRLWVHLISTIIATPEDLVIVYGTWGILNITVAHRVTKTDCPAGLRYNKFLIAV